jgi:integrase
MGRTSKPYRHATGQWTFTFRGQQHYAPSQGAAWIKLASLTGRQPGDAPPVTVAELVARFALSRQSSRGVCATLRTFSAWAGAKLLSDIGPDTLHDYARTQRSLAPWTARRRVSYARAVLQWAHSRGWIAAVPERPRLATPINQPRPISDADRDAVLAAVPPTLVHYIRVFRFVLETGCRPGEACALPWSAYKNDMGAHGAFVLSEHKTAHRGRPRTIYLTAAARAIVDARPRIGPYVFHKPGSPDVPLLERLGQRAWLVASRRALGRDTSLYQLRHAWITRAIREGVPVPTVARMAGHRWQTMQRYADVADADGVPTQS